MNETTAAFIVIFWRDPRFTCFKKQKKVTVLQYTAIMRVCLQTDIDSVCLQVARVVTLLSRTQQILKFQSFYKTLMAFSNHIVRVKTNKNHFQTLQ